MTDTITVRGFVATEPKLRQTPNNVHVTGFRLASRSRRFDPEKGEWVDTGMTNWYTVNCYRYMADNVVASLRVGDPVLIQGRLKIREWSNESGARNRSVEIEASALGPDLAMGSATYTRAGARGAPSEREAPQHSLDSVGATAQDPDYDPATGEVRDGSQDADVDPMTGQRGSTGPMVGGPHRAAEDSHSLDRESEIEVSVTDLEATGV